MSSALAAVWYEGQYAICSGLNWPSNGCQSDAIVWNAESRLGTEQCAGYLAFIVYAL